MPRQETAPRPTEPVNTAQVDSMRNRLSTQYYYLRGRQTTVRELGKGYNEGYGHYYRVNQERRLMEERDATCFAVKEVLEQLKDHFGIEDLDIIIEPNSNDREGNKPHTSPVFSFKEMTFFQATVKEGKITRRRRKALDYHYADEMFVEHGEEILGETLKWAAERQAPPTT